MPTEQWDIYEVALTGPTSGNPFLDVELSARFTQGTRSVDVRGFYDGDGTYRVRFMPDRPGKWTYVTKSSAKPLSGQNGSFECVAPRKGSKNHGPVRVANTFHFAYADGIPYRQIGTTCYAWTHQPEALQKQTLATLKESPFNKLRMCVFPKHYAYNSSEPQSYPFEGTPPNQWDFSRLDPRHFQHLDERIGQLRDLGIECDLILFHPYDGGHWGFDRMPAEVDDRYLRYVVARFAAYRNIWWSMANEFDFMKEKRPADWDRFFKIVRDEDPYEHLRSIHNGFLIYDHNQPWCTHASIQNGSAVEDFGRATLYRDVYRKPVVFDEVKYEGDLPQRWGDLSAEEMVHRFWQGTVSGTYVGHGETYLHPKNIIWWASGGKLHGESPKRLAFLKKVLDDAPPEGIDPIDKWQDLRTTGKPGEYYLVYFGREKPKQWLFELPRQGLSAGMRFRVEVLDTWNMTTKPVAGVFEIITDTTYRYHAKGRKRIKLPGKPYLALRVRRIEGGAVKTEKAAHIYGEG